MITFTLFLLGLFLGSFGNVVSLRLHTGQGGIIDGESECPKCKHKLSFWENFPLIPWVILGGKCRHCKAPIGWQYPAVELLFGLLFAGVGAFLPTNPALLVWALLLVFALGILIIHDLRYMELPDQITIPTILLTIGFVIANHFLSFTAALPSIESSFIGGIGIGAFFVSIILIGALMKREVMGGGDIRLGILMGFALGWQVGFLALFLSYIIGTIITIPLLMLSKKDSQSLIPFGPFLAAGLFICLLWGEHLLDIYLRILGI